MCKESSRVTGPGKVRTQLSLCTAPQGKNTTYLLINASLPEMTALHSNTRNRLWLRRKQRHVPSSPSPACWTGQKFSPVSAMEIKNRMWLNPRALTGCCTKAKTAYRCSCLGCNKLIYKITCLFLSPLWHLPSQEHPSRSFPPFPILEQVLVCHGQCSVFPVRTWIFLYLGCFFQLCFDISQLKLGFLQLWLQLLIFRQGALV